MADSACSATAYLCGVKANYGTIGVSAHVPLGDCHAGSKSEYHVDSLLAWAQKVGKGTGIVTTTRITHASPSASYAHVANRNWECDSDLMKDCAHNSYQDIASQLVYNEPGRNFNVILGGGRKKFLPTNETDDDNVQGQRLDGINLIEEWKHIKKGQRAQYISKKKGLSELDTNETDYVLGLFHSSHMSYNLDVDHDKEPSVAEMTVAAIRLLQAKEKGYVLFVEGGRIDHAHHENKARKALDETVQVNKGFLY